LKTAVQAEPSAAGLELANWSWKVVRQFAVERFDIVLSSRTCLNYLHRLGFVVKRPKKRLQKANAEKRAAFVAAYVALRTEARTQGAKIFFVDEAHFRADVALRAKWVLRGEPALVDSTSPKLGEKATYYSAVCLETGEVEAMVVSGNTTAETSVTFMQQLRENHEEPLIVIWDNGLAHHGPEMCEYLTTPDLKLRRTRLRYFFKKALRDFLPAEILAKEKHGFGLPAGVWLRDFAPLNQLAGDSLASLRQRNIFRGDLLDGLTSRQLREHPGYYGTLTWVLMMLELWFQNHVAA
jgi:hypothetical protein